MTNPLPTAPRRKPYGTADLLLTGIAAVWGSSYITTKLVIAVMPVMGFLTLRFGIAFIVFSLYGWPHLRRLSKRAVITGLGLGLLLAAIFLTETFGIAQTSALAAGFLISLNVVFVPFVERLILRYSLQWSMIAAMLVALLGTALIMSGQGGRFPVNTGDALVFVAALLRATQVTVTKAWLTPTDDVIGLNVIEFGVVFLVSGLFMLGHASPVVHLLRSSPEAWVIAGYLGVVGTVVAFIVQMWGIQHSTPARVALLLGLEPAFAAIFAVLGGESMTGPMVLGGLLIVLGTFWGRHADQQRAVQQQAPS